MDFDRIYNSRRQPAHLDDFLDSNVQALIEGRRKHPMLRPNVQPPRPRQPKLTIVPLWPHWGKGF